MLSVRTAYATALLVVALAAAYCFGALTGGLKGYLSGSEAAAPPASQLLLHGVGPEAGGPSLLLLIPMALAALGAAVLYRKAGSGSVLDMLGEGRLTEVQLQVETRQNNPTEAYEVLLATTAAFAAFACALVLWGVAEGWHSQTVAVLGIIAGLETVFGLGLLVLVVVRRPQSLRLFAPSAVVVAMALALVTSVILLGAGGADG